MTETASDPDAAARAPGDALGGAFDPERRYGAAWSDGVRLFEAGEYWECHEALEPPWLASDDLDRHFLGGVILLAAALHKARAMGSPRGGRRNYAKALAHLAHLPDRFGDVDVRELEARVHAALRDPALRPRVPVAAARARPGGGDR